MTDMALDGIGVYGKRFGNLHIGITFGRKQALLLKCSPDRRLFFPENLVTDFTDKIVPVALMNIGAMNLIWKRTTSYLKK